MFRVNGLYGHVRANDLRSLLMFGGFIVAMQLVALSALLAVLLLMDQSHHPFMNPLGYLSRYGLPVLVLGAIVFAWQLMRHVGRTQRVTGFYDVTRRTEPRLVAIVEQVALTAGLPTPMVGMMESPALNAFACGFSARDARIVVTRALVNALDDDELAAVVAHEMAHVMHGDIRRMACANAMVATVEDGLAAITPDKPLTNGDKAKLIAFGLFLPPFGLAMLMVIACHRLARFVSAKTRWLIGASREFIADAEAVRLTQNPSALISALGKVQGRSRIDGIDPFAEAMMIDGLSPENAADDVATHPGIEERIRTILSVAGTALSTAPRRDTREVQTTGFGKRRAKPSAAAEAASMDAVREAMRRDLRAQRKGPLDALGELMERNAFVKIAVGCALLPVLVFLVPDGGNGAMARIADYSFLTAGRSKPDPVQVVVHDGCIVTEAYSVRSQPRKLGSTDARAVRRYLKLDAQRSSRRLAPYRLARLMAAHDKARRAVPEEMGPAQDAALLAYIATRKDRMMRAHRDFGDEGLKRLLRYQNGSGEYRVLELLRLRVLAGDRPLWTDERTQREVLMLLNNPEGFVPCRGQGGTA